MAEIAAGALVAEQVVSTTLEGGVIAGYAVAKPTVPLKATFSQIATVDKDDTTYYYPPLTLKDIIADVSLVWHLHAHIIPSALPMTRHASSEANLQMESWHPTTFILSLFP
jgi:hypothetical protein